MDDRELTEYFNSGINELLDKFRSEGRGIHECAGAMFGVCASMFASMYPEGWDTIMKNLLDELQKQKVNHEKSSS